MQPVKYVISQGPPVVIKPGYSAFAAIENIAVTTSRIGAMLFFHLATVYLKGPGFR